MRGQSDSAGPNIGGGRSVRRWKLVLDPNEHWHKR